MNETETTRVIPDHELAAVVEAARWRHRVEVGTLIEQFAGPNKAASDIPADKRLDFIKAMEELMK
jgi:hypothetical protein